MGNLFSSNNGGRDREHKKINVLFIFPLQRDYVAVESLGKSVLEQYEFHFMDSEHFSYSSKASPEFSLVHFIQKCIDAVTAKSIDMVISTRDIADLVHGVLAMHFDHIRGPNYFASFLAIYKPYTKLFIDTDEAIGYELVNKEDAKWSQQNNIQSLIQKLNGKGFMKPPAASCSSLVGEFSDQQTFEDLLAMHAQHGKIFSHYLADFVDAFITADPYQCIDAESKGRLLSSADLSNVLLVEEFMATPIKVTVDGFVTKKQIHIWGVIDSVYWTNIGKNECFVGCFMPSNLSQSVCSKLVELYKVYVNRLIDRHGFDDQFIDIEFFVLPKNQLEVEKCSQSVSNWKALDADDVELRMMEINARAFMQMTAIYRQLFDGFEGDAISTMLSVYRPDAAEMRAPRLLPDICGLNGYLPTFSSGTAEELFDFEAAEQFVESGEVILAVERGDAVNTVPPGTSLLAYANVTGKSYQECFDKLIAIGNKLIRKGAPWQIQ